MDWHEYTESTVKEWLPHYFEAQEAAISYLKPPLFGADDLIDTHGDLAAGDDVPPYIGIWAPVTHTSHLHLPHKA